MKVKHWRYVLGLDIGIASVGWALLDMAHNRIIDLGVRCFDKAETADKGESLNLVRRMARLARRRIRHRRERLRRVAKELADHGLVGRPEMLRSAFSSANMWHLRVAALDRRLEAEEWARVIYHICKHRGFHWRSKAEEAAQAKDKEGGRIKQALNEARQRMQEKGYRTAAEMVVAEFPDAQRNKRGDYSKSLPRTLLADELAMLFKRQRELGNPFAGEELERAMLGNGDRKSGLLWEQKPALSGEELLAMLGFCTFEKNEYRAPKASFTVERHVLLTRVNNMRLIEDGHTRKLTDDERRVALALPYQRKGDVSYAQLRKAWEKAKLVGDFTFAGLRYSSDDVVETEKKEKFVRLGGWHAIRKAMEAAGLSACWRQMADAATNGDPAWLDGIAWALSVYKEDDEAADALRKLELPGGEQTIEALLSLRFDGFGNLSLKALHKILPHMEQGLRYDEACALAGYHHSQPHVDAQKKKYLPPFYVTDKKTGRLTLNSEMDLPRNPVVLRALNQARKVVNAIIREYGPPMEVHIEMARDLSRPLSERKRIERAQQDYREQNENDRRQFIETFGREPEGKDFAKWQLYREQQGKCAYSLAALDIRRLFEPGYVEIDHALPYSRSFDDSKNNKVLCFARENRNKGNRTPYEYLDGANDSDRWRAFVAFVKSNKAWRPAKKNRLLRKDFDEKAAQEFRDRNLNDTRYICRFFKNYVEQYLALHEESGSRRCTPISGGLTAMLRVRWGLRKIRSENDRHHALDAAVVAACGHWQVQQMNTYAAGKGWFFDEASEMYVNSFTGESLSTREFSELDEVRKMLPPPWPYFRQELEIRLFEDDQDKMRERLRALGYDEATLHVARPLFVSRMSKRRGGGALHAETVRSAKRLDEGRSVVRMPLEKLTWANLKNMVGYDDPRNAALVRLLESRLEAHDGDPKKAFAEPVFKPSAKGKKAPIVRAVKVATAQNNGFLVRGGVADLGEMSHVEVWRHKERFLFVPRYPGDEHRIVAPPAVPEGARFLFPLWKNDYLKIRMGDQWYEGYVVMYESHGPLTLRKHDQPQPDRKYFRRSVASARQIIRCHVDVLGRVHSEKASAEP